MAKRQLNRRQNWRIEKIQNERAARAAKREQHALQELEGGDLGPEQLGLVIAFGGACGAFVLDFFDTPVLAAIELAFGHDGSVRGGAG